MPKNTARIAKNTLILYFRHILVMLVSFYTVRVVLNTLRVEDYGIYNVVAGTVTMFGVLSESLGGASLRYISFDLGRNDFEQLKMTFSLIFLVYVLAAIVFVIIAETIGLWFISSRLKIPDGRINAALWVYHLSIFLFVCTVLLTPYRTFIIAHEDMNIYAGIALVEAAFKLIIVWLLRVINFDKLQLYGIFSGIAAFLVMSVYYCVCTIKYKEYRFRFYWNKSLFKEITGYTGWISLATVGDVFRKQVVVILLNQFFNAFTVSARSIAFSITTAVSIFFNQFITSLRPQIIKTYAADDTRQMLVLVFGGIKLIFFLIAWGLIPRPLGRLKKERK
jgi:O-antigen/teichoic acid export membrane protein